MRGAALQQAELDAADLGAGALFHDVGKRRSQAAQLLAALQLILGGCDAALELTAFGGLIGLEWALYLGLRIFRRTGFEAETLAFFLCTMGLAVVSSSAPESLVKELLAVCAGVCVFLAVCWSLRDLERAKAVRYLAAVAGMGLLVFNLIFGVEKYGARNWIQLGGLSFQPSEFVKVCFIYVGASTLSRLMAKRNIILFIAYSAAICACLALMKDFGTAVIFFVAFLVIAFLRSGNFATIALALAATGFAGVLVLRFLPYARNRFEAWGHVWDYALTTGYSQTRSMMCIASGGLFGLGPGKGWLKYVAASDTDLVFAFVSEEWGLILAILMVACIVILACFVVRSAPAGRSCFYTIGACAAVTVMVTQTILNVFGMADFLPLTGVTFPFVSNGGSSMVCVWGLLAFIKAADTRQNASFAIRLPHGAQELPQEQDAEDEAEENGRHDERQDGLAAEQLGEVRLREEVDDHVGHAQRAADFALNHCIFARDRRDEQDGHIHDDGGDGRGGQEGRDGHAHDLARALRALHVGDGRGNGAEHRRHRDAEHQVQKDRAERLKDRCALDDHLA